MLELLSPAGSPEGVIAAVQNGADAVYLGFGNFNARRNAKNFTEQDLARAAEYCRIRGVKLYVTLNTLATDREMHTVAELAKRACRAGADAILVQDLGVLRAVRQVVPEMPVHASTQMSIHNLEGVRIAAAMGVSRVVLARELPMEEIRHICENSPIEIEVFAHGALCMCYSGQCYMSAVIGRRSGNRGLCAQPCRLGYLTTGRGSDHPLSLKDNCLVNHLHELEECGVTCIKIEGRMRRPEYSAIVTSIYSRAIRENIEPTEEDMALLTSAFSRQGFTDGYFTGRTGPDMLGIRTEEDKREPEIFSTVRHNYMNGEFQRVPVHFMGVVRAGLPAKLAVSDDQDHVASTEGPIPEPAFNKELTPAILQTQLYKTGGTPFKCAGVKSTVDKGLSIPLSAINNMRRKVLLDLFEQRRRFTPGAEELYIPCIRVKNRLEKPSVTVSVQKASQLSDRMAQLAPKILYIPLEEIRVGEEALHPFLANPDTTVCIILPRVIHDGERDEIAALLRQARRMGISEALVGNLGQVVLVRSLGFEIRGDFGLNIFNSHALEVVKNLGFRSAALSFELRYEQVRDISKCIDTELIAYGRLPLMITENCIVKNASGVCSCDSAQSLLDKNGFSFPIFREFGCRNVILNSKKLFLADRSADYEDIGLWAVRLAFTTENDLECAAVLERYMGMGDYMPTEYTRGLYYRGVE